MSEEKNYVYPFTPHILKYSQARIEELKKYVIDGFKEQSQYLDNIKVSFEISDDGEVIVFSTPVGKIKSEFALRLDGEYLGVALVFTYEDNNKVDVDLFHLILRQEGPWQDSSGVLLERHHRTGLPETYHIVQMMQRVLGARLMILDKRFKA